MVGGNALVSVPVAAGGPRRRTEVPNRSDDPLGKWQVLDLLIFIQIRRSFLNRISLCNGTKAKSEAVG